MVTNGHVIHMMGHATQALRVRVSQEVHANQGLKHSSLLSGEFKIGGQGREHSREKDSGRKVRLGQSRSSQDSLKPGERGRIYSLPRLASPRVTEKAVEGVPHVTFQNSEIKIGTSRVIDNSQGSPGNYHASLLMNVDNLGRPCHSFTYLFGNKTRHLAKKNKVPEEPCFSWFHRQVNEQPLTESHQACLLSLFRRKW